MGGRVKFSFIILVYEIDYFSVLLRIGRVSSIILE